MSRLTATGVKKAKARGKPYKLHDGGGMYLLVNSNGSRYWRFDYRFNKRRKTLALGVYPDISLAEVRKLHQAAREDIAKGTDPSEVRKIKRLTRHQVAAESFEAIGREWFARNMEGKSQSYHDRTKRILEKDLYPVIGNRPITKITAPELLAALRRIEDRGAVDIAHRAKQTSGLIFRYAVASGRAERDTSADITGALKTRNKKHYAAITDPKEAGRLLVAIDGFVGTTVVKTALKLSPLLFQRPGEIRHMEWSEIDWDQNRWEIPAVKMKMKQDHIVPLCRQAQELLRDINPLTGRGRYVFPSARGASRPLSENGVRTALRTLGYTNEQMSPHGFRAMARTILDEVLEYPVDWIEHQLAHAVRDPNGRAYNRTVHLKGRTQMMQDWADLLDELRKKTLTANVLYGNF